MAADAFVSVEAEERQQRSGREVIVRVRDNGIGVEPNRRANLFERFYRAHAEPRPIEGTGLGLSLVREMVESVGGRAWAEFTDHESAFLISLPLRRGKA